MIAIAALGTAGIHHSQQCLFGLAAQELRKYGGGGVNPDVRIYSGCRRGVCWRLFVISLVTVHPRRDHGAVACCAPAQIYAPKGRTFPISPVLLVLFFLNPLQLFEPSIHNHVQFTTGLRGNHAPVGTPEESFVRDI